LSHPAPRRHAVKLRHGFFSPAIAVPPAPTFTLALRGAVCPPPAPSASLMASAATLVDAWLARRTASEPALRGRRAESAHRLRLFRLRRVRVACGPLPRRRARSLAGCAGGQWVATPPCAVLHFVARRRLTALKRTAAMPGRVGQQGQKPHQLALRVCWLESARVLAALDCTQPGRGKSLRD
jgi:hypothetical protein